MHAADRAALWRLDVKGAGVRTSLAEAGVPSLLLKGRAFAALLYADGAPRFYCDCDLLIPTRLRDRAQAVLSGLGFVAQGGAVHARSWHRAGDDLWVDLHHTLPQLDADADLVWAVLWARATSITVGDAATLVLDPAAAALLSALHVVHHGPQSAAPLEDLARAIDQLDSECWRHAGELARELGAQAALGTGLRLLPAGVKVAERLGLEWAPSAHVLLNWHEAPWGATIWESLAGAPRHRARARLVAGFLAPSPRLLRERSALARRGWHGLLLAYLLRPFLLAVKGVRSFRPWRRARRTPREPWAG